VAGATRTAGRLVHRGSASRNGRVDDLGHIERAGLERQSAGFQMRGIDQLAE